MKYLITITIAILFYTTFQSCGTTKNVISTEPLYQSNDLVITQVSENAFMFTSFLPTDDFGLVPGNGVIIRNNNEAIVFNTTADDKSSEELIKWISDSLHCKINEVIPTHYHPDCLGGLRAFENHGIPSYAFYKTIDFAKESNFAVPQNSFRDSLILKVGNQEIIAKFFGEGHTRDNIICYYPKENVMFGGCLIKELNATKGYLKDANLNSWSASVEKVKEAYPNVKVIVPGHGKYGGKSLLDYTIALFKTP